MRAPRTRAIWMAESRTAAARADGEEATAPARFTAAGVAVAAWAAVGPCNRAKVDIRAMNAQVRTFLGSVERR
jgi:hypothetical protein